MKPLIKSTLVLLLIYFAAEFLSVFMVHFFGLRFDPGITAVIFFSYYFVSRLNRIMSWKEALFFSGAIFIVRLLCSVLLLMLGGSLDEGMHTLLFSIVSFVFQWFLFRFTSIFYLKIIRLSNKHKRKNIHKHR